jgi:hypothetical protein
MPVLDAAVKDCIKDKFYKPILELGTGDYSTPFLNKIDIQKISVESDREWFEKVKKYRGENHIVKHYEKITPVLTRLALKTFYSICLIDNAPGESRGDIALLIADKARYVIMHDAETSTYGYAKALSHYKYKRTFRVEGILSETIIASNFKDVNLLDITITHGFSL